MYSDLFYSFTIGSVGAILFLLVDKYDEGPLASLLKFLILFVAGAVLLALRLNSHAIEPSLLEPRSPLPGNGIFRAETKRPKRL